jgi:hypothetical protein
VRRAPLLSSFTLATFVVGAGACGAAEELTPVAAAPSVSAPADPGDAAPPPAIASFVPRCVDGDFDRQRHGATCLCCHAEEFGVAGSVDPTAAPVERIVVTDAHGDVASLAPNAFANFFRHFRMTPPLQAIAYGPDGRAAPMRALSPSADCNACHGIGGSTAAIHGP